MARTWLSVSVELIGGRGTYPWPWPGRYFAVGPSHTFAQLADAINDAFARWDKSHLSMFTLADGRDIMDVETGIEFASDPFGPLEVSLDIDTTTVARTVKPGDEFRFVFDLGDDWKHLCRVHEQKIDPMEELGIRPKAPLPYWGWGEIPDQYGRRWADDEGDGPVPRRPKTLHPIATHEWPTRQRRS
ncbi:pRiA4b ORF-3-like protein [Paramicrobacterium humi]|uniref:PRiA4b ORF-3-like protein n=2 Tax=Paramicrobacterium humi TaxID=640635 RepID=A0A1H4IUR0_9MICO|nr:pRiA4b ORF-3-like protein [Microbacterium humi]